MLSIFPTYHSRKHTCFCCEHLKKTQSTVVWSSVCVVHSQIFATSFSLLPLSPLSWPTSAFLFLRLCPFGVGISAKPGSRRLSPTIWWSPLGPWPGQGNTWQPAVTFNKCLLCALLSEPVNQCEPKCKTKMDRNGTRISNFQPTIYFCDDKNKTSVSRNRNWTQQPLCDNLIVQPRKDKTET